MTPRKGLVSLLQLMYEYKLADLAQMWTAVLSAQRDLLAAEALGTDKPDDRYCERLAICLDGLALCCDMFDADSSLILQMRNLENELKNKSADTRCPVLNARLRTIIDGIQNNLESRKFMFIPKEDATYWNSIDLFGTNFGTVFPAEAIFELMEMGRCFATSRAPACVFHCMRIAEYGLRILAQRVHVKLTDKGKPIPIEYGTWDKVITGIRNQITEIRKKPIGPRKEKALQFYSAAADHCDYMKDIWRNEIAHSRHRFYTREEVLGVISRVRLFARLISDHEIPKNKRKHLARIHQRIQELQRSYDEVNQGSTQQNQSPVGSGEGSKKAES